MIETLQQALASNSTNKVKYVAIAVGESVQIHREDLIPSYLAKYPVMNNDQLEAANKRFEEDH